MAIRSQVVEKTGIYQKVILESDKPGSAGLIELFDHLAVPLSEELDECEVELKALIAQAGIEPAWPFHPAALNRDKEMALMRQARAAGKSYRTPRLDEENLSPSVVRDALEVLRELHWLKRAKESGDLNEVLFHAFRAGRWIERLSIRPFERPAKVGRKQLRASDTGRAVRSAEWDRKRGWWETLALEIWSGNGKLSAKSCAQVVLKRLMLERDPAPELPNNLDTIRKAITHLKPS